MVVDWGPLPTTRPCRHVFGRWMTRNRSEYYRQCVMPGCSHYETKKAPSA